MKENQSGLFEVDKLLETNAKAKAQKQISSQTWKMLRVMLKMLDADKSIVAMMLEFADLGKSWVQYLAGPISVNRGSCGGGMETPEWLYKAIILDRFDLIQQEFESGKVGSLATPGEVLAVMMPVTLEVPLRSDWVDVYLWAGNEVMTKHNRMKDGQTFWDYLDSSPVTYNKVRDNYTIIATDIRSKVVDAAKERGWGAKAKKAAATAAPEKVEDDSIIQIDLLEMMSLEEPEESVQPPSAAIQTSLF